MKNLTLLVLLSTLLSFGQNDHLEPARDFKNYNGVIGEYYDHVFTILNTGFNKKPIACYTVLPSFTKEYSFSLEIINDKYYILSNSLSKNYWYAKDKNSVKLTTNKTEISEELFLKIKEMFELFLKQTKPIKKDFVGGDGINYYFSNTDINGTIKMGETWSPFENTNLNVLIKIGDTIFKTYEDENTQNDIIDRIDNLIKDIEK